MRTHFLFTGLLFSVAFSNTAAQEVVKTYTTKLIPLSVTYNASDNPGECWEAVTWGILIKDDKNTYFFSMPFQELERLKEKMGDEEVVIEVVFYDEPIDDSGTAGNVVKITFKGEIVFGNP